MSLKKYQQKRNFAKTSEPSAKQRSKREGNLFVVQKHAASHLHYDFRLELHGVLKSWAVPKGPCLDPSVKRLAIEVEDHPLNYANFEGIIPKGEYGGGTVMVWDNGTWESEEDLAKAYHKGDIKLTLYGQKLKGAWKLIRTNMNESKPQWLLIKVKDFASKKLSEYDVTNNDLSILTQRNLEEIAENLPSHNIKKNFGIKKSKLPVNFKVELATLVKIPPEGNEWLHEIKLDGYRILAFIENNTVKLISRNNQDWTEKFLPIAQALKKFKIKSAILDGELVVLNEQGHSDFQLLQNALSLHDTDNLHYFIFDLPFYNSTDLTKVPLLERKELLESIFNKTSHPNIHYSNHVIGNGKEIFTEVCANKLEGIISKRVNSHYHQARTDDWVKVKCIQRQEFIIVGYTAPKGARNHFGSLLLGYYDEHKKLIYCGHVGTGFTEKNLEELYHKLVSLRQENTSLAIKPPRSISSKAYWVKPKLIAEIEFIAWTNEGYLRHPSFLGLREDKPAKEVKREESMENVQSSLATKISHPDKILYPKMGITKLDLADYYMKVADRILPHIQNRPLALVRCPSTVDAKCFYQKNWIATLPKGINAVEVETKSGSAQFITIADETGLLAAAQLDVLEIHPWGCRNDMLNKPDRLIFDLDPSPEVKWKDLKSAVFILRDAMNVFNLKSFVKLTGGKGIHLVIPINRNKDFKQIKLFAKTFSEQLALNFPKLFTTQLLKQERTKKIFIDYLRNDYDSTAIAPFSPRARENATIAVPISWEYLEQMKKLDNYNILTWRDYLQDFPRDPWVDFFAIKQGITQQHFKLLGLK